MFLQNVQTFEHSRSKNLECCTENIVDLEQVNAENEYLDADARIGVETAENEPLEVSHDTPRRVVRHGKIEPR